MHFDRHRARLELNNDEMRALVRMVAGDLDPATAGEEWVAAGIVDDGEVNNVAGSMIRVALDAPRAASIQRFDGASIAPLFVGIDQAGRATLTETASSGAADDTAAWITATRVELLAGLIMQAIRLHPGLPNPSGREPVDVTAADIGRTLARFETGDVPVPTDQEDGDDIERLLASFENGWQAAGGWQRQGADTFVTVFNAGRRGLWFVEAERVEQLADIDPESTIRLVPCTVAEATARLGDVVTGRRSERPASAA